jgi:hypothetical protein
MVVNPEAISMDDFGLSTSFPVTTRDFSYLAWKRQLERELISIGMHYKVAPTVKGLQVRDLMPSDLGLTTEQWLLTIPATTTNWVNLVSNFALKATQAIYFYGVAVDLDATTPPVYAIRFQVQGGVATRSQVHFEYIHALQTPMVIFQRPVPYYPSETVTIPIYGSNTGASAVSVEVVLLGLIVEPRSFKETISQ